MQAVAEIVNLLFEIYFWIIIARIFLTWIPSINWYNEPFKTMAAVSDVLLQTLRKIIPPIGGIDISPMLALFVLYLVRVLVIRLLLMI